MKIKTISISVLLCSLLLAAGCSNEDVKIAKEQIKPPIFKDAVVHDPSVIKVEDTYYVIGSHLQSAKTTDLMQWTQISTSALKGNKLVPNPRQEFGDALKWEKAFVMSFTAVSEKGVSVWGSK